MTFLNKLKTLNYHFITNSGYTKEWLAKWHIPTQTIYPYLHDDYINFNINTVKKEKIILSVGRFFRTLHAKRQDLIINLFKKIKQQFSLFKEFRLILTGGLKEEDKEYFDELKKISANDPSIVLLPNIDYCQLFKIYQKSLIYWHFAGFGVDENAHPELVEHLGITPLEAMACGCITCCYRAGGPKEIIQDGKTGYLFENIDGLINKTKLILAENKIQKDIKQQAKTYIVKNFSYETFKNKVKEVIL